MKYFYFAAMILILNFAVFAGDVPGKEACERLNNTDLYKACKPVSVGLSQGWHTSSAELKCECMSRKDNSKVIVDIGMYNY